MQNLSTHGQFRGRLSCVFLSFAVCVHLLIIGSLFSEPFTLEHGKTLVGSRSHPQETDPYRGYLDTWFHDTDRVPRGLDFFSIYQAGRNFLRGQSVYYGVREHRLGEEALVVPFFSGFRYLPAYACVFGSMLNLLPPWHSYWTWVLFVEILLLLNIHATKWLPVSPVIRRYIIGMWLAYSPYYVELHIGQQSMVTVTLLHICIIAHVNHRPTIRNGTYIASVLWKINTLLFLPLWIKFRQWKTIVILFVTTILLSAPYFLAVEGSFQEFGSYFHHKFIATGPNSLGFWAFISQFLLSGNLDHSLIKLSLTLWSLAVCVLAAAATLLPKKVNFPLMLCMWICVYFLTYQYVWEHHYVLMLPIFSAGMLYQPLRKWTVLLWLFCASPTPYILLNDSALSMPQVNWSLLQRALYHGIKIIPVLMLFFKLCFSSFNRLRETGTLSTDGNSQLDVCRMIDRVKSLLKTQAWSHSTGLPAKYAESGWTARVPGREKQSESRQF
jgi:hypothetical protein